MKNQIIDESYLKMSYDNLLIYALYELQNINDHTTFENLVAKTFELFPKRFQLPGYPGWPDSSLVEKSWLRCRSDKALIYGSKSKGFTLTPKGLALAEEVFQKFQRKNLKDTPPYPSGDSRTRSGRLVKHIEKSTAFQKFISNKNLDDISEFEFCDLLYSTLDTAPTLRRRNLEELKYHVEVYRRHDLLAFLEKCQGKFRNLLEDLSKENYEGGMMKRKKKK